MQLPPTIKNKFRQIMSMAKLSKAIKT